MSLNSFDTEEIAEELIRRIEKQNMLAGASLFRDTLKGMLQRLKTVCQKEQW